MAEIKKLTAVVEAEDRTAEGFKSVESRLSSVQGKIQDMQPAFKKMAAVGTVAFAGIAAGAAVAVKAIIEQEKAHRQLEHAVVGVSKGTKAQVEEIKNLADALEKKSGVDADALKMGAAQLSTFGLQTSTVVTLTKTLADLTVNQKGLTASGDDYVASANIMAKVLQGQFGILEKSGIRFTELQQEIILTGTESEKASAIIEGLNQNLRETTDTIAGSTEAQMAILKARIDDVKKSVGKGLTPALGKLMETVKPVIERIAVWTEQHPELTGKIILAAGAVAGLVAVVGTLGMLLPGIITMFTLLAGPVGIVIAIIGLLALTIRNVVTIYETLRTKSAEVWDGMKILAGEAIDWILGKLRPLMNLIDKVRSGWSAIRGVSSPLSLLSNISQSSGSASREGISAEMSSPGPTNVFNFNSAVAGDDGIRKIINQTMHVVDRQSTLQSFSSVQTPAF